MFIGFCSFQLSRPAQSLKEMCEKAGTQDMSESVSTGVWCVPGFGAGFEIALEPSKLQKEGENRGKEHFDFFGIYFWYAPKLLGSKVI